MSLKKLVMVVVTLCMALSLFFSFSGANGQVSAAAAKYPIIALASPNGTISPSGVVLVASGSSKKFSIKPDKGCHIVDVLVDKSSMGKITSYTFTNVTGKHTIHALFASGLMINAGAGAGGSISPSGLVPVTYGQKTMTFTFTPNQGYHVSNVIVDGAGLGPMPGFTFKSIKAAHSIIATFSDVYPALATASAGGSISPSGVTMIEQGTKQMFTLTPQDGYKIVNVRVDEVWIGTDVLGGTPSAATWNLTGDAPHDIAVVFGTQQYPILSKAGKHGTISPLGTTMVKAGDDQEYTVTPESGYVASIVVDGEPATLTNNTYTFEDVAAPHIIVVAFTKSSATASAEEEP
jgi:hypothetical protein